MVVKQRITLEKRKRLFEEFHADFGDNIALDYVLQEEEIVKYDELAADMNLVRSQWKYQFKNFKQIKISKKLFEKPNIELVFSNLKLRNILEDIVLYDDKLNAEVNDVLDEIAVNMGCLRSQVQHLYGIYTRFTKQLANEVATNLLQFYTSLSSRIDYYKIYDLADDFKRDVLQIIMPDEQDDNNDDDYTEKNEIEYDISFSYTYNLSDEEKSYREGFLSVLSLAYYSSMSIVSGHEKIEDKHILTGFMIPIMAFRGIGKSCEAECNKWIRGIKNYLSSGKYNIFLAIGRYDPSTFDKLMDQVVYHTLRQGRINQVDDIVQQYHLNIQQVQRYIKKTYLIQDKRQYGIHMNYTEYSNKYKYAMLGAHDATFLFHHYVYTDYELDITYTGYLQRLYQGQESALVEYLSTQILSVKIQQVTLTEETALFSSNHIQSRKDTYNSEINGGGHYKSGDNLNIFTLFLEDTRTLEEPNEPNRVSQRVLGCPRKNITREYLNRVRRQEYKELVMKSSY